MECYQFSTLSSNPFHRFDARNGRLNRGLKRFLRSDLLVGGGNLAAPIGQGHERLNFCDFCSISDLPFAMCSTRGWVHAALPLSVDGTPSLARCRDTKSSLLQRFSSKILLLASDWADIFYPRLLIGRIFFIRGF